LATENAAVNLQYVKKCPKCRVHGTLRAHWTRKVSDSGSVSAWCGPYYSIRHTRLVFDRKKYYELRRKKMPASEASARSKMSEYCNTCYFGRACPVEISEDAIGKLEPPP
jgi:hypothetical protein